MTWFTADNFYPHAFDFETYNSTDKRFDLSRNEKFEAIFSNLYQLLHTTGGNSNKRLLY
jgi:hypothetical protein